MQIDKSLKIAASCLLVAGFTQLTGCGTRHLNLFYPPEQRITEIPSSQIIENAGPSSTRDVILDVFDARTEKTRLSDQASGFFSLQYGAFASDDNVAAWVNDAIAYELTEAGYSVFKKGGKTINGAEIELTVDVQKVFGAANVLYEAEVLLQATLQRTNELQLTRQYAGEGSAGLNMAATGKSLAKSMALALQDAVTKMLVDFELIQSS